MDDPLDMPLPDMPDDLPPDIDPEADLDMPGNVEADFLFREPLVAKPRKFADIPAHRIRPENAEALVRALEMPPEGGYVEAVVPGAFVFGDILRPLCLRMGGGVDVVLSTLSYSPETVGMWAAMFAEGSMASLSLVVSDYFFAHERGTTYRVTFDLLAEHVRAGRFRCAVAGTHTKLTCLGNGRWRLLLRGSANLRSSENVEEFMLQRDAESYEFHRAWMLRILDRYEVTRRPLRHEAAWSTITE